PCRGLPRHEPWPPHQPRAAPRIANRRRPYPGGARFIVPRHGPWGAVRRRPLAARDRDYAVAVCSGAAGVGGGRRPRVGPSLLRRGVAFLVVVLLEEPHGEQ